MSTASSGMLAPAALISENLIKPLFQGKLTDRQLLWILRFSVLGVAILAVWMALQDSNIYELVAGASILMLVSLFIPLTAGLYWKKSSKIGAMLSMVIGMLTYLIIDNFEPEISSHIYGLFASAIAMLIGSLLFPNKIEVSYEIS